MNSITTAYNILHSLLSITGEEKVNPGALLRLSQIMDEVYDLGLFIDCLYDVSKTLNNMDLETLFFEQSMIIEFAIVAYNELSELNQEEGV